jgi:hypothetical protein
MASAVLLLPMMGFGSNKDRINQCGSGCLAASGQFHARDVSSDDASKEIL